ncbi:MAG: redoxin domain-containing protein [Verrucomicrobiales bacterium]|nr:redoxin domain-containing protein [Verrucomicrobiales bacterium]
MSFWDSLPTAGQWLLKSSAQASVLVLVVLAVQGLCGRRLPARWRHALWWLVVIRLVLPLAPASGLSLFNWAGWRPAAPARPAQDPAVREAILPAMSSGPAAPRIEFSTSDLPRSPVAGPAEFGPGVQGSGAGERAAEVAVGDRPSPTRPTTGPGWPTWLGWLWGAGVVALAGRLGYTMIRLRRALAEARPLVDGEALCVLEESRALLGVRRRPPVLETPAVSSPALCGLWRPRLLLPPGLVGKFTSAELRLVFLHELAHLQRRDIAVNWLTTLLQLAHWFNPLVWLAFQRMRADSELACDAVVLGVTEAGAQRAYGQTIIKLLEGVARPAVTPGMVGILEDPNQMQLRIRRIARFRPTRRRAGFAGLTAVMLGWVCLTDAPAPKPAEAPAEAPSPATTQTRSDAPEEAGSEVRVGADPEVRAEDAPHGTRSLTVRVVNTVTGEALPGAEILAPYLGRWGERPPKRLTDDRGEFRLVFAVPPAEGRREMSNFSVSAHHPDFAPRSVMWTSSAGDVYDGLPATVSIGLESGVTVGGRVVDEWGTPLAGVRVLLSGSGFTGFTLGNEQRLSHEYPELRRTDLATPAAVTDANGRWTYPHFPADLVFVEVTLARPDGSRTTYSTVPEHMNVNRYPPVSVAELRAAEAVLTLPDGLTVRGLAVDEAGQPLAGVTVLEGYGHGNIVRVSEFTTGSDGRFERPHRVPRQWIYTASRADRATVSVVAQVEPGMGEVRLVLPPAQPLRFRVVDEAGQPLSGVQLNIDTHRSEAQILDWTATTDASGSAVWTNAPTVPVTFYALAKDPPVSRKFRTTPGEAEKRIVLKVGGTESVTVRVQAVDAASGEPVKVTRVATDFAGGGSAFRTLAEPRAGEFTVLLDRREVQVGMYPSYRLRFEADGYETLTPGSYDFDEGDQELQLQLTRSGAASEWRVRQPNGQPADGARAWVDTTPDGSSLFINGPTSFYGDRLARATADTQGRLALPSAPADAPVVVAHATGFLATTVAELQVRPEVQLVSYGVVEGRLLVAGRPKGGVNLSLSTLAWSPKMGYHLSYTTTSAPDGGFRFEKVPPGDYKLYRWQLPSRRNTGGFAITETCQWPLTVRPGETNRVEYAFRGRPVVGQAVADPAEVAVDWQNDVHVLALKLPPTASPPAVNREDFATFEAFRQAHGASFRSNARVAEARRARTFQLTFEADGAFRVEDVPPGTYELRVRVTKPGEGTRPSPLPRPEDELGSLTREVVVPEGTDPLDLGTLMVAVRAEAAGSKAVPLDFAMETLDGRAMRLAEVKGARLVVLWAAWSERSREALEHLQKMRESLGTQAGLTIVGVSLDDDLDSVAKFVREGDYDWLQTRLAKDERARVVAAFDLTQLPTIFLVDARGRVVNRDLEGERLRAAVQRWLARP